MQSNFFSDSQSQTNISNKILYWVIWVLLVRRLFLLQKVITSPLSAVPLQLNHKIVVTTGFSSFMVASPLKNLIHCYQQAFQLPIQEPASFFTWNKSLTTSGSEKSPAKPTNRRNRLQHCMALLILLSSIQTAFPFLYQLPKKFIFFFDLFILYFSFGSFARTGIQSMGNKKRRRDKSQRGQKIWDTFVVFISFFASSNSAWGRLIGSNATSTSEVNDSVTFRIESRPLAFWGALVDKGTEHLGKLILGHSVKYEMLSGWKTICCCPLHFNWCSSEWKCVLSGWRYDSMAKIRIVWGQFDNFWSS